MRVFAGIELDAKARAHCVRFAQRLQAAGFSARYEPPEKLHVTLAFLGAVDAATVVEASGAIASVAADTQRFTLTLDRLGAFPDERRPRVVWLGMREPDRRFAELSSRVVAALRALGFELRDDPIAHVTIARVKGARVQLPQLAVEPIAFRVRGLTLFESIPDRTTTRYVPVSTAPLAAFTSAAQPQRGD